MAKDDYEVGYGRPPKKHQFQKGKSGNPRGKPKGSRSTAALVEEELNRLVEVTEDGRTRKISLRQVIVRAQIAKAAKGSVRHAEWLEARDAKGSGLQPDPFAGVPREPDGRIVIRLNMGESLPKVDDS